MASTNDNAKKCEACGFEPREGYCACSLRNDDRDFLADYDAECEHGVRLDDCEPCESCTRALPHGPERKEREAAIRWWRNEK